MDDKKFVKLSDLVNATIRIERVWGYKFKMWDQENHKMLISDSWQKGYRKVYDVDVDKGKLSLSANQIANMLEACMEKGVADLNGKQFEIKSNGKSGMDIRYFFNLVRRPVEKAPDQEPDNNWDEQPVSMDDIPF